MELIASGRDSDIFELAPGLVLRRSRGGRSLADEARVMEWAREHGYPVPRVDDVRANGTEIVMERVDGRMMMDDMARDPRKLPAGARLLADLHDQLHEIPAPDWLRHVDAADRLLHLDLHPLNVMIKDGKPIVIDWSNAAAGDPLTDVALSYVLLQCPDAPLPRVAQIAIQPVRVWLAHSFARRYRGRAFDEHVLVAGELKRVDANMRTTEVARIERLGARIRRKLAKAPG
jgi:aminoglycoside phosphotransferase (APT) family kinase protein